MRAREGAHIRVCVLERLYLCVLVRVGERFRIRTHVRVRVRASARASGSSHVPGCESEGVGPHASALEWISHVCAGMRADVHACAYYSCVMVLHLAAIITSCVSIRAYILRRNKRARTCGNISTAVELLSPR